jgi:hypothetical protein
MSEKRLGNICLNGKWYGASPWEFSTMISMLTNAVNEIILNDAIALRLIKGSGTSWTLELKNVEQIQASHLIQVEMFQIAAASTYTLGRWCQEVAKNSTITLRANTDFSSGASWDLRIIDLTSETIYEALIDCTESGKSTVCGRQIK